MKFLSVALDDKPGVAVDLDGGFFGLASDQAGYPGDLLSLIRQGPEALRAAGAQLRNTGQPIDFDSAKLCVPLTPGKILCVGLNYADHAAEAGLPIPEVPTLFSRFASSIVAAGEPIRLPRVSAALDFEGELAVIIGKAGRYIKREAALNHVAGYSAFNDASLRDYQLRTPQWTIGKNFDGTGPFGPVMTTPDALPPGASGLAIETRLNGQVMQKSSTDQLIFDVATLISTISEAMTLEPGDVIVTGTPAGVGAARTPPIFMGHGDVCEVEIEGIGILYNAVARDS